jgi:pyridoxal phosphate enzyme (YggS family)
MEDEMTETRPRGPGSEVIATRLEVLRLHIESLSDRKVRIVGVTKGFAPELVLDAYSAGIRCIGENYAQELVSKSEVIGACKDLEVHFIGQLQTNKVRHLVGRVDRFDTVDRPSLASEIARRIPGARVLIQVDTGGSPGKGGCAPTEVPELCKQAGELGLKVEGLMTVGPTDGGPEAARPGFATVRALADSLDLDVCSMGMSQDLDVAISEGATEVRIGTGLFGSRQ